MSGEIGFQASASVNDGAGDPPAQTALTELVTITLPGRELGEAETTKHDQAHFYKTFKPTLIDGGTLKVECQYTADNFSRINALFEARAEKTWEVTSPDLDEDIDPQKFSFPGFVKKLDEMPYEREGIMQFKFEIRVVGPWTITGGEETP